MFNKLIMLPRQILKKGLGKLQDQFITLLNREIGDCESLLDVGCGFNSPLQHLHSKPKVMVGVDVFEPAIAESRAKAIHNEYYIMDILKIADKFPPKSFDAVVAFDVIEHLSEENAIDLICQMEKIAKNKVLLFTPNGFLPQGEEFGNPWQKHISGWTVRQMKSFGYRVYGIEGLIYLRGEMARIRWKPTIFWYYISLFSQIFTQGLPSLAFRILCVKDIRKDCLHI